MQRLAVKFAPLGKEMYEYTIVPAPNDIYLIQIDGIEVCSIQMRKDGTDVWETCGDAGLTDEELDFLASRIRTYYM
jgi:hypothetical protein